MIGKAYSQIATEAGKESIKRIRQTIVMIENELQAFESQFALDAEDSKMLKDLNVKLEEAFEKLVEAAFD